MRYERFTQSAEYVENEATVKFMFANAIIPMLVELERNFDAFGRRIGKSSSTQKSSKFNQRGQLVRFPSNLSSLNTTDRPQRNNTLMLWDGNRQVQEYTDEQIFTTVYEQNSFEPVARIVQLASHIEQKRLADIGVITENGENSTLRNFVEF